MSAIPIQRRRIFTAKVRVVPPPSEDAPLLAGIAWTPAYAAFIAYLFAITTYRLPIGAATVAMSIALVTLPMERRPLRFPSTLGWTVALLGWALFGWTTSSYPNVVRDAIIEFAKIVGVVLVAVNVLNSRARFRLLLLIYLAFFAFYPVRGALIGYFVYGGGPGGRAAWNYVYENPNDFAGMCILVAALAAGVFVTEHRRWIKACALAGVVVLPALVLLSQSRGAFIGLLVSAAVAFGRNWRRGRTLLAVAAVAVVTYFAAPNSVWKRLGTVTDVAQQEEGVNVNDEGSARQRLEIWKVARAIIIENPITGVGIGAYQNAHYVYSQGPSFDPMASGRRDTHSTYLNVMAETGIAGFLIFIAILGVTVLDAERTRRRMKATHPGRAMQLYYMELGLLGYLIAGIWGSYGGIVLTYLYLALMSVATQLLKSTAPAGQPRTRGTHFPSRTLRVVVRGARS